MNLLDNYLQTWNFKYNQNPETIIRDTMLLMDSLFLMSINHLNDSNIDILARAANVHIDYVKNIVFTWDKVNQSLLDAQDADKIKEDIQTVTDVEVLPQQEALQIVTDTVQQKQEEITND